MYNFVMEKYWILLAFGSCIFAGATSILAKIGINNVDSHFATAIRTCVVAAIACIFAAALGQFDQIGEISQRSYILLILSGLATGGSWMCYFYALKNADASKVAPIDKSSTILAILLATIIFPDEPFNEVTVVGLVGIAMGTVMMLGLPRKAINEDMNKARVVEISDEEKRAKKKEFTGLIFALLSAIFAAFTSILAKLGMEDVPSQLGTALRTLVVLVLAWGLVLLNSKHKKEPYKMDKKSFLFLILSGITTGLSWVCYYAALKFGKASVVIPIDKLSIVITVLFAWIVLKEKPTLSSFVGLVLISAGTLTLVIGA